MENNDKLVDELSNEVQKKASFFQLPLNSKKIALVVIDMINDGCRKGGAFDILGFDVTQFQKIEKNVLDLIIVCKKNNIPIIYVKSIYDHRYLPKYISEKFKEMMIGKIPLAHKGLWGTEIIDSLPPINDYTVVKSHFTAFAPRFSLAYKEAENSKFKEYLKLSADEDNKLIASGESVLTDFYLDAAKTECELFLKGRDCFLDKYNKLPPSVLTLHTLLNLINIDTVICAGGSTNVCLASTVYSAAERAYNIILPIDSIASENSNMHWVFLNNFSFFNSTLSTTCNLINAINNLKEGVES